MEIFNRQPFIKNICHFRWSQFWYFFQRDSGRTKEAGGVSVRDPDPVPEVDLGQDFGQQ